MKLMLVTQLLEVVFSRQQQQSVIYGVETDLLISKTHTFLSSLEMFLTLLIIGSRNLKQLFKNQ